jgi:hypothetical protein
MNQSVQHASSFREHLELHKSIPSHSFKSYNAQFDPLTSLSYRNRKLCTNLLGRHSRYTT